jgi:uncharacterized protein YwqG
MSWWSKKTMSAQQVKTALEPWFARHRRQAWLPETSAEEGEGDARASRFGGTGMLKAGESWPTCKVCGAAMALFVQLELGRLPEEGGFGEGLLQLFYCVESGGEGRCTAMNYEPFSEGQLVRILAPGETLVTGERPAKALKGQGISGWKRIDDFPGAQERDGLGLTSAYDGKSKTVGLACAELGVSFAGLPEHLPEDLPTAAMGDKLGGWPSWVQGVEYPACPRCGKPMDLVVQLESNEHLDFMFGDAGTGHITRCPEHREVVAFAWACS